MAKPEDALIVRAAAAIERELARLEELSQSVCKIRLHNEKSIVRASRELEAALAQPALLTEGLAALARAMATLEERQIAALTPLQERALEIQRRSQLVAEYMAHFETLGAKAAETSEVLKRAQVADAAGETKAQNDAVVEVGERLAAIAEAAMTLAASARGDDLPDIARDADALRQKTLSLRERLKRAVP